MGAYGSRRLLADEQAAGVLGDGFEHVVAQVLGTGTYDDQRVLHKQLQQPDHLVGGQLPLAPATCSTAASVAPPRNTPSI